MHVHKNGVWGKIRVGQNDFFFNGTTHRSRVYGENIARARLATCKVDCVLADTLQASWETKENTLSCITQRKGLQDKI